MLVDDKYSSALFLDYGGTATIGPLGKKSEAFAAVCELTFSLSLSSTDADTSMQG